MNRSRYFNYIEEKLNSLSYRIRQRGKINLLDLHIYSETFFAELMGKLLGYNFININQVEQNTEGIDLIDRGSRTVAQVSSICSRQKIENSLSKETLKEYSGFRFKFIATTGEANKLKGKDYVNPYGVVFDPLRDIYDIADLLRVAQNLEISRQRTLYEFIKEELGSDIDVVKMDSNLATIIDVLSQEDLSNILVPLDIKPFEILRKIEFNSLISIQSTIDYYKIFYGKLDEKYKEFDRQGMNKSISVLSVINGRYNRLVGKVSDPQDMFFKIIDDIIELTINSKNYVQIPYEELEMCVSILVVDAFIRCKIFKNPEGYDYAATR